MHWPVPRTTNRMHIAAPVRIHGVDANGKAFDCEAWTLNVSPTGACIQLPPGLDIPKVFHVVSNDYQLHADAQVVVIWERIEAEHLVGIQITRDTPPTSWQAR